jgi:hypothetical protein
MFQDDTLKSHLESSTTILSNSAVIAEWNMNISENIYKVGNYRYRPTEASSPYRILANEFDEDDAGYFYTNATYADVKIDLGLNIENIPQAFASRQQKEEMLYSLEDCFYRFRPRSGINKLRYLETENQFVHYSNSQMANRPRYYMSDKNDSFKYWTSYRTETTYAYTYPTGPVQYGANPEYSYYDNAGNLILSKGNAFSNEERGIANEQFGQTTNYRIDDAAPFIVYWNQVPTNRIVLKMQTNVGSVDLGPFANSYGSIEDPFYGQSNQTTPVRWRVQYLDGTQWIDATVFDNNSVREDGTSIIKNDGYVELSYGLVVPEEYSTIFSHVGEYSSGYPLPTTSINGFAYLLKTSETDVGTYHIYINGDYETFTPKYEWFVFNESVDKQTRFVTDFTSPSSFIDNTSNQVRYREFQNISGLRVVVETMNKFDSTFDLIEMSPRLVADISDKVTDFSITKTASDLGVGGLPVGQLLASTGSLSLFDYDQAWNSNNSNSIISDYVSNNIQIKFYEVIMNVDNYDYYVPIKTLYTEGFPETNATTRKMILKLRDLLFYFESMAAPEIIIKDASVSYAVAMLLDSIGFSNYSFKRVAGEKEAIIPYFFIAPGMTIAQVLNEIAVSTQTAMFFDEYNNFVMMSKNYIMPDETERATDSALYGTNDSTISGIVENSPTNPKALANIIDISSQNNEVFNDGKILYASRSIEKSYGKTSLASVIDQDKTWIYKPVLLWEVSGTENTKSVDGKIDTQSSYSLSAIPLNSDLSANLPEVSNLEIINNVMDFGEGVYWISRYNGYFYANGEIIRYDAVQYSIPGIADIDPDNPNIDGNTVWITSTQEYYNYFAKLPFNGKIYPTGLVRIYCEPNYEQTTNGITQLKNGAVSKHGRGQFGTEITTHFAGLSAHWASDDNIGGCEMDSEYLFNDNKSIVTVATTLTAGSKNGKVSDISLIKVGQIVKRYSKEFGWISVAKDKIVRVATVSTTKVDGLYSFTISENSDVAVDAQQVQFLTDKLVEVGLAGATMSYSPSVTAKSVAKNTTRNGIIKNFLSTQYSKESVEAEAKTAAPGTIQSSALIMGGPSSATRFTPIDFISYVHKPLNDSYKHFGSRMRIIGQMVSGEDYTQSPVGSSLYYTATDNTSTSKSVTVSGASGGIGVLLNPENNNGYYFEIIALTDNNVESYKGNSEIHNIVFYKIMKDVDSSMAIPVKLWGDLQQILVDDGRFTGQSRVVGEENTTIYDLAVEYQDIGSFRRFFLYLNDKIIATVDDPAPLEIYNNMALFVRGSSRLMFENVYALAVNYSQNSVSSLETPVNSIFSDSDISANEAFKKYSMSGIVKSTYLSGISSAEPPKYKMYFEEFGTIMREASYFNIKYDVYPTLYAKMSPTYNRIKGYTVSGFISNAYGAEFLIFNSTDTIINLDSTSGNYLRIQGVTFTQETNNEITVDDYFSKLSDFSNPVYIDESRIISPDAAALQYYDIRSSRITYGRREFTLDATYIQNYDDANDLLGWMVRKVMKPRKSIGVKIFSNPMIQLGDIVTLSLADNNNVDLVAPAGSRFVVYNIEYSKNSSGPSMTLYLSEVI